MENIVLCGTVLIRNKIWASFVSFSLLFSTWFIRDSRGGGVARIYFVGIQRHLLQVYRLVGHLRVSHRRWRSVSEKEKRNFPDQCPFA